MNEALYEKGIKCPICNNDFSSKKVRVSSYRVDRRDEDFCTTYKGNNPMYYEIIRRRSVIMNEALYEKGIKCPICKNDFSSKKVRVSSYRVDRRDEDFCTTYKGNNPMYYEIIVCPQCGYAASESYFDVLSENEIATIKKVLAGKVVNRSFCGERTITDALDSFKLALFIAKIRDAKDSIMAGITLKLAWIYREMKEEKENVFLQYTLDYYRNAYDKENLPLGNLDEISLQYLLGELSRRLNKLNDAIFWFNKAVSNPSKASNPRIEKMAREQWILVKEQYRKAAQ